MKRAILILALGVGAVALPLVLVSCGGDTSTPTIGATTTSSSSSSGAGGEGGSGGVGGAGGAGMGGMGQGGGTGGTGGMGTGGAGGSSACMAPSGDACPTCLYDKCNAAFCDCAAQPGCFQVIPCAEACAPGDNACVEGCYQQNSLGFSEFLIVSECAATACLASCPGADQVGDCELCLAQKCEAQFEACVGNPACTALINCVDACPMGDMNCQQQCAAQYAAGANQVMQLNMCAQMGCSVVCK